MQAFLEYVVKGLVDQPDAVRVTAAEKSGLTAYELRVAPGDAGKIIGRPFDADQLKAIGAGMEPNSSAIVVIVEDTAAQQLAAAAGLPGANVVTVTLGSQLSGELAQFAAVELGEDVETTEAGAETVGA